MTQVTRTNTVTYNKSRVMKRAWKLYKAQEIKTMEQFSACMKESWNIEKNGYKHVTIEKIYKEHYTQIFNLVNFKINNRIAAEEITNDVFLKADQHLSNYDVNTAKVLTWLYTIANNKVIDFYRSKKDNAIHVSDFQNDKGEETIQITDNQETDYLMDADETNEAINRALDALKPKYKKIAKLYFIDEKKYSEIADILDISLSNVKVMINRCRAKLQESLQGVY